ncbi:unnamed protein product [Cyclocybe aegerita]|uniref:NACHT domain-containing protein n=1 Tax=Cyclocybe aegerita TaxID=1973307 RepID=A0A8S0XRF7_CYCAE|nr:unnamed protein product [Cyclocybe aegerita]
MSSPAAHPQPTVHILGGSHRSSIEGSTINVNPTYQTVTRSRGIDILTRAVSPNAFHNSDDRPDPPKCHENTRVAIIKKIMDWVTAKIDTEAFMLWLYGPAGAGKSAIARTVAELCEEQGLLLASFLFFRTDARRNTMKPLVANLAYRISCVIPAARAHIEATVEADPLILSYSLQDQFVRLLFEPLRLLSERGHFSSVPLPPLIIIDGLDECLDEGSQTSLIRLLFSLTYRYQLPLKFLITSRPEADIKPAFAAISPVSHLELNDDFFPDDDIRLFLEDKFREIRSSHPFRSRIPSDWPNEMNVDTLVQKASGQFIHASLAARFVDSPRHLPNQRLEILLDLRPPTNRDLPFAELDNLYTWLLSRVENPPLVLQILGVSIALKGGSSSVSIGNVEYILDLEDGDLIVALTDLGSILRCHLRKPFGGVQFHHRSFEDFLLNPQRSKEHYVDGRKSHTAIAQRVLRAFRRTGTAIILDPRANSTPFHIDLKGHLASSYASASFEYDLKEFSFAIYSHSVANSIGADNTEVMVKGWIQPSFGFLQYLQESNKLDLYRCQSEDFITHIISWFEGRPYPENFNLLNAVWQPRLTRLMYCWTLQILDGALRTGGKSDQLTNALSKPIELWPLSVFFPRRVRRLKKDIATYMDKFGPRGESPEDSTADSEAGSQCEEDEDCFEELSDEGEVYFSCSEYL